MSLIAMQRDMRAWLMAEDDAAATALGTEAAPGLRIHLNNYRTQLIACLAEGFEYTQQWLGWPAFEAAAATYIDRVPPSSWTLDAYAHDFPATLAGLYPDDPEVAELAWIECALSEAFVGPDAAALPTAALGEIDWDRAVLRFTPTLDIAEAKTNAPSIWSALSAGEVPPGVALLPKAGAVMVWRREQMSQFRAVDAVEHQALLLARSGISFADLCAAMVASYGEDEGVALAGGYLGRWVTDGLIVRADVRQN